MKKLALATILVGASMSAQAVIGVYSDFASYDAAVASVHTHYLDFDTDKNGGSLLGLGSGAVQLAGNTWSDDVVYSTPNVPSLNVNAANIGQGINVEIGPEPAWTGVLRWDYGDGLYYATAFTGIDLENSSAVSFFRNGQFIDSSNPVNFFGFSGFVTDFAFDAVEIEGNFFAIDAHYSTAVPEPGTLLALGLGALAAARRRKA